MLGKKDPKIFLEHILESITRIESDIGFLSEKTFTQSITIQDAVIRRLEIIGEAVRNLPELLKNQYPKIPWKQIAGLRDVLIHQYFGVDIKLVWRIIRFEIPKLKKQIQKILNEQNFKITN